MGAVLSTECILVPCMPAVRVSESAKEIVKNLTVTALSHPK
jgi:hypothetical protein